MGQDTRPGFSRVYARVIEGGDLRFGDPVELLPSSTAERIERTQPTTIRWRPPSS